MRRRRPAAEDVSAFELLAAVEAAGLGDWREEGVLEEVREFLAHRFGVSTLDYIIASYAVRCGREHEWEPGKALPPNPRPGLRRHWRL